MGKGEGKKVKELEEGVSTDEIVVGDKTRSGACAEFLVAFVVLLFAAGAVWCFIYPLETYQKEPSTHPHSGQPHSGAMVVGPHARKLANRFYFSHSIKEVEECTYNNVDHKAENCVKVNRAGAINIHWLAMMFSTFNALGYFLVFTIAPGWAYKIHFRGGTKCCRCIPLNCGKSATAPDEQTHQADQMSRMLGICIGVIFGLLNFFTRCGMGDNVYDGLLGHAAVWLMLMVFNFISVFNKGSPRCYSLYQAIWCASLAFFLYLLTGAMDEHLKSAFKLGFAAEFATTF